MYTYKINDEYSFFTISRILQSIASASIRDFSNGKDFMVINTNDLGILTAFTKQLSMVKGYFNLKEVFASNEKQRFTINSEIANKWEPLSELNVIGLSFKECHFTLDFVNEEELSKLNHISRIYGESLKDWIK
jgi:hypothetical protein